MENFGIELLVVRIRKEKVVADKGAHFIVEAGTGTTCSARHVSYK